MIPRAILEREVPPHEIHAAQVTMTLMNGKVWHERPM
jgi:hypothetical protein